MKLINTEAAEYFYSQIIEINQQEDLSIESKIQKLRNVLESLFKELTSQEGMFFSNLHSRMVFIFDKHQVPEATSNKLHSFRRYANKIVHEEKEKPTRDDYLRCLRNLCFGIKHMSDEEIPNELFESFTQNKDEDISENKVVVPDLIPYMSAVVLNVKKSEDADKQFYNIYCETERLGKVSINLWNHSSLQTNIGNNFILIGEKLWKYCRLHLLNLKKINDDFFSTTTNTIIVIEPDYLVDVTEIAECFQQNIANHHLSLLKKFKMDEPTKAILLGSFVNLMLDEIALGNEIDIDKMLAESLIERPVEYLYYLNNKGDINLNGLIDIKEDAKNHLETIVNSLNRFQDFKKEIEPTFISSKYGIQGRLDLLSTNKLNTNEKHILELKSGGAPSLRFDGLWSNHKMQVQLYDLLVKSVFPKRTGSNMILYSKAMKDEQPLRNSSSFQLDEQNTLMVRNLLVADEFNIAFNDLTSLSKINQREFGAIPKFMYSDLTEFEDIYKNLTDVEMNYFHSYLSFINREQILSKIGSNYDDGNEGFAALWKQNLEEKIELYNILDYLQISEIKELGNSLEIRMERTVLSRTIAPNFRNGDICILYPQSDEHKLNPLKTKIIKCTLKKISKSEIIVVFKHKQPDIEFFNQYKIWFLEHDSSDNSYKMMYKSLFMFLKANEKTKGLLLGEIQPEFTTDNLTVDTQYQGDVVNHLSKALKAKHYYLLQGPPGTGKTSVFIRELARMLYTTTEENFVLLAFTNRAVDEICEQLVRCNIEFIRLGKSFDYPEYTFDNYVKNKLSDQDNIPRLIDQLLKVRVFVSTQNSFINNLELLTMKKFNTIIVDEASQLIEPQLIGILSKFDRFILVGDEKQLPAVVQQDDSETKTSNPNLNNIGIFNLKDSLFHRLIFNSEKRGWNECKGMLVQHGRMHDKIADFVNREFYNSQLASIKDSQRTDEQVFSSNSNSIIEKLLSTSRVIFINTPKDKTSKVNLYEAKVVGKLIERIFSTYNTKFTPDTVGVITPYRAQIASIINYSNLPDNILDLITIDTVERYQGSQRDIIVMSIAVNHVKQLRFLQSLTQDKKVDRKLNVGLTRAKNHLILIGNKEILYKNEIYKKLIKHIEKENGYFDYKNLGIK